MKYLGKYGIAYVVITIMLKYFKLIQNLLETYIFLNQAYRYKQQLIQVGQRSISGYAFVYLRVSRGKLNS